MFHKNEYCKKRFSKLFMHIERSYKLFLSKISKIYIIECIPVYKRNKLILKYYNIKINNYYLVFSKKENSIKLNKFSIKKNF